MNCVISVILGYIIVMLSMAMINSTEQINKYDILAVVGISAIALLILYNETAAELYFRIITNIILSIGNFMKP